MLSCCCLVDNVNVMLLHVCVMQLFSLWDTCRLKHMAYGEHIYVHDAWGQMFESSKVYTSKKWSKIIFCGQPVVTPLLDRGWLLHGCLPIQSGAVIGYLPRWPCYDHLLANRGRLHVVPILTHSFVFFFIYLVILLFRRYSCSTMCIYMCSIFRELIPLWKFEKRKSKSWPLVAP